LVVGYRCKAKKRGRENRDNPGEKNWNERSKRSVAGDRRPVRRGRLKNLNLFGLKKGEVEKEKEIRVEGVERSIQGNGKVD